MFENSLNQLKTFVSVVEELLKNSSQLITEEKLLFALYQYPLVDTIASIAFSYLLTKPAAFRDNEAIG